MSSKASRLAGLVIVVIGAGLLVLSTYYSARALVDPEWLDAQLASAGPAVQDNPMLQPPTLTWIIVIGGLLGLVEAGLSVVLGIYTCRGRRWAILTSIILSVLRLLIVGLLLLLTLLIAAMGESTAAMSRDLLFAGGAALVLLALIGLLIAALRAPQETEPQRH